MKINEFQIKGFKSIGEIIIKNPNPFSVFVGPNASGKSNIFEALEFLSLCNIMDPSEVKRLFGKDNEILNLLCLGKIDFSLKIKIDLGKYKPRIQTDPAFVENKWQIPEIKYGDISFRVDNPSREITEKSKEIHDFISLVQDPDFLHFSNFSRIFINNTKLVKRIIQDDAKLALDGSNLEKVLKRILKNEKNRDEIIEILQLLIPGFEKIEIKTEELSSSDNLLVYEDILYVPLPKRLISDGTFNIIAIISSIFQSDQPQFLCIEEPENGLNPKVVKYLVKLFRDKCEENGHYIWLTTHSQSLVAELNPEEVILVDKVKGLTRTKQIKTMDLHGLKMDEALLTNAIGGGIPW